MKSRFIAFIILTVLFIQPALPASADIAPDPAPHGGAILPEGEITNVRMMAETVVIEVQPNSDDQMPFAMVNANFQMRNLSDTEETMSVRFPMNLIYGFNSCIYSIYPPIQNFQAWVDGEPAKTTYINEIPGNTPPLDLKAVSCWATFPVTFPPDKDIAIDARYRQEGASDSWIGFAQFPYVLATGAGWAGTIGSAAIVFRAPWPLTNKNLEAYFSPRGGIVNGNEIRWQLTEYEPQDFDNVEVSILNPAIWRAIVRGREGTVNNPQDGEAWGKLGKALKEAIVGQRGFRYQSGDYFKESYDAYQKAVELKPWDADWHYGFADLVCMMAAWPSTTEDQSRQEEYQQTCVLHLKRALEINPLHEGARELLLQWVEYFPETISLYRLETIISPIQTLVQATQDQYETDEPTREIEAATHIADIETKYATLEKGHTTATYTFTASRTYPVGPEETDSIVQDQSANPGFNINSTNTPPAIAQVANTPSPSTSEERFPNDQPDNSGVCGSVFLAFWMVFLVVGGKFLTIKV